MINLSPTGAVLGLETGLEDNAFRQKVVALDTGGYVVLANFASFESEVSTIWTTIFDADGGRGATQRKDVTLYFDDKATSPDITALQGGGYMVAWQDKQPGSSDIIGSSDIFQRDLKLQVFGPDGAPVGAERSLASDVEASERNVVLTTLNNGNVAAAWQAEGDVYMRLIGPDGTALTPVTRMNTTLPNSQIQPAIQALADGGFVAAWNDIDRLDSNVIARRFDSTGQPVSAEFMVHSDAEETQILPSITSLEGGGFGISWEFSNSLFAAVDVALFDASGTKVGADLRLGSGMIDGSPGVPGLAPLPGGGLAAVWAVDHGADEVASRVVLQTVDATGTNRGTLQTLPEGPLAVQIEEVASIAALQNGDLLATWIAPADAEYPFPGDVYGQLLEVVVPSFTETGGDGDDNLVGGPGDDALDGGGGNDTVTGLAGEDRLLGGPGNDELRGGDGADTLNGGPGDDVITGGATAADLRDVVFGGAGNDSIDAGHGNDQVFGQDGNDTIAGGFGVDDLQGQGGDDVITGSAFSDLVFGGAGDDFVNGGFGFDRINGGTGADKFFHAAADGHGSDWLQDYSAAEGDVLVFGGSGASTSDFVVRFAHTATPAGERSGDDEVQEAFVNFRGQTLWALVDGGGQDQINLQIGADTFDLLA